MSELCLHFFPFASSEERPEVISDIPSPVVIYVAVAIGPAVGECSSWAGTMVAMGKLFWEICSEGR